MAIIKGGVLWGTSGKVGTIVVKNRQGTLYAASLPVDFHMSMKPHEVEKRDKFSAYSKFSSGVNKNNYLFKVWGKTSFAPKMIYNRITQLNSQLVNPDRPSKNNVITPPGGFAFKLEKLEYYPGKVLAEIQPLSLNENEEKIVYLLYVCLYAPNKQGLKYFDFIQIKEGRLENSNYIFYFTESETKLALNYCLQVLYLCGVTLDVNGNVVRYSETHAADMGEILNEYEEPLQLNYIDTVQDIPGTQLITD